MGRLQRAIGDALRVKSPTGEAWVKSFVDRARFRHLVDGIAFDIDEEYAMSVWSLQDGRCAVCKLPFDLDIRYTGHRRPMAPSMDRIDSDCGYVRGNIRFVLQAVNLAINDYGLDAFIPVAAAIAREAGSNNVGQNAVYTGR
jgi:hypothetical protein